MNKLNCFLFCIDNFSDQKQLRGGIYFVDFLPMTPSGKIQRRTAKEIVLNFRNSAA